MATRRKPAAKPPPKPKKRPARKPAAKPPAKPRKAPARKPAAKASTRRTRKPKPATVDLYALGGRVVSVFGPFASRVLIELPVDTAAELFTQPLGESGRKSQVEAVERELAAIEELDEELAQSALAMLALALAYEIEHPYNSATSKSMCARSLLEALDRLRELMPSEEENDRLDQLSERRAARRGGSAGT